jgi:hypothetical protein
VALTCSGIGITMVFVVALATLLRRGWRPALFQLVPLAALQVAWLVALDAGTVNETGRPSVSVWLQWVWDSLSGLFLALGHFPIAGFALAALLVTGLAMAWTELPVAELRRLASAPMAMLIGAVTFYVLTGYVRWTFDGTARAERYMDIGAALALPALALAVEALVRRWRVGAPLVIGLLLIGVPWNVASMAPTALERGWYSTPKRVLLGAPQSPLAQEVPPETSPVDEIWTGDKVTIGWLLAAEQAGKLPVPPPTTTSTENEILVRLGVSQSSGTSGGQCASQSGPVDVVSVRGDTVMLADTVFITTADGAQSTSPPVQFGPNDGRLLTFEVDGLPLRLYPGSSNAPIVICH